MLSITCYGSESLPCYWGNRLRITSRAPSSAHYRGSCRHSGNSGGRGRWRRVADAGRCEVDVAKGLIGAVVENHTSSPPFRWQYSAMSLTIDWNDCVWQ